MVNAKKIILEILAAFGLFIVFNMITMKAEVSLSTTFLIPDGVSLDGIEASGVNYAAAVDGKVVVKEENEE